jgi:hypothetical protein
VFKFVDSTLFEASLPSEPICESIEHYIQTNKIEVVKLLSIMLPKIAEGFAKQRGSIFGFGHTASESTGSLFKIADATDEELDKLNRTNTRNLSEERCVGHFRFELGIRGKNNLESASRKLVLNKSFDLLETKRRLSEMNKFRKEAKDIKINKNGVK